MEHDFPDTTLLLAGHGSTLNADSAAPIYRHADEIRRRGWFDRVIECFWKLEPTLAGALRGAFTSRVCIVPLFISEGYFTEQVLPRELGFEPNATPSFPQVRQTDRQTIYYAGPIGTHESMTEVILSRARATVEQHPYPRRPRSNETALFVAGHGTGNNENSRKAIERQVELIRAKTDYAEVHGVFMEEDPSIGDCYRLARSRYLVMVPFFISDGLHSHEDIPVMLGEAERRVQRRLQEGRPTWRNPTEKNGKLLWYTRSIGDEPHIPEVIRQRVREALAQASLAPAGPLPFNER